MTFLDYFYESWCSLSWTPWVPFDSSQNEFKIIPSEPGLYRVRPLGKEVLMYIGETQRSVRERLNELRHNLKDKKQMPWNDPHTAAPSLWAWRDAEVYVFECSAAPLHVSRNERKGWESYLLASYRQQCGESTLCNFGRFHKRYRKSTNRKKGIRGRKLENFEPDNPAGGLSCPPLQIKGKPGDQDWMSLAWSKKEQLNKENIKKIPKTNGLYLLFEENSEDILYIGQSTNCSNRLAEHSRKILNEKKLYFSLVIFKKTLLPYNLLELENDLIGNYFQTYQTTPLFQFGNY